MEVPGNNMQKTMIIWSLNYDAALQPDSVRLFVNYPEIQF